MLHLIGARSEQTPDMHFGLPLITIDKESTHTAVALLGWNDRRAVHYGISTDHRHSAGMSETKLKLQACTDEAL